MTIGAAGKTRISVDGKFFRLAGRKFFVKGFSYGPFAPNSKGEPLPEPEQVRGDLDHMSRLGANAFRVYFPPPRWLLEEAGQRGLFVFIDIPWEKHRCFFEDWPAMEDARRQVRRVARELGNDPAVFAISVVNEFPVDIVLYQGRRRVERFVEDLLAIVKNEAPDCLTTFVNYPTTEFLDVRGGDFTCFNVYLHEEGRFSRYLDRLQHIAGNQPLILGEYGIDSRREGEPAQAEMLTRHLRQVYRHGLAGSFVFAYTDDWYTGGHQIDDWFFGVTSADRREKPAARELQRVWPALPQIGAENEVLPKVSVVVCTHNGAKTLGACLHSLTHLDYPDYEVICVDDGSTDETADIARGFPSVRHHFQENRGLSAARNAGARLADGEIVAYTDDDCVADELWLLYLVQAMQDQRVEAIGGPNISPDSDGWVAKCVAASPGNPSHVMLDDRLAEHVPGCNMAFRRSTLLGIGGFDEQFRVAGDDVDVCWRMLDADLPIGYAPGAMVWHHRRASVRAYAKQQRGYGRSEAMVHFKHPQRCGRFGRSQWQGIIYGEGAVGLPLMPDRIYHGRFAGGLFQTLYRHNHYSFWSVALSLEWHFLAAFLLLLALLHPFFTVVAGACWTTTLTLAGYSAVRAPLPRGAPWWCRPLVAYLYLMQPVWRGWDRLTYLLRAKQFPRLDEALDQPDGKRVSAKVLDFYWDNDAGKGRDDLLASIVDRAQASGWAGDFDNAWTDWDIKLVGDPWHDITIRVASEELGWPRRFTRARCHLLATTLSRTLFAMVGVWGLAAVAVGQYWALAVALAVCGLLVVRVRMSRASCFRAVSRLIAAAAVEAGLSHGRRELSDAAAESTETPAPGAAAGGETGMPSPASAGSLHAAQRDSRTELKTA